MSRSFDDAREVIDAKAGNEFKMRGIWQREGNSKMRYGSLRATARRPLPNWVRALEH